MEQALFYLPALAAATAAVYTDTRLGLIPNRLTFPTALAGLALHGVTQGWAGLAFSAEGAVLGFGLLLLPFLIGGMGAGDVKLLGGLGAVLGPAEIFSTCVFSCMLGGLIGLAILIRAHGYTGAMATILGGWRGLLAPEMRTTGLHSFPYASAILFGVLASLALRW